MSFAVVMEGVRQEFGPVLALDGVTLAVRSGHIHALVGENGAGKTTLMRALYGALKPTAGAMTLFGQEFVPGSQRDAIHHGVGMVSQHYSIIPELTCLQNLMLGEEPGWAVNYGSARDRAEELAGSMGFAFDWDSEARGIGPAQAQKLEILKLLWRRAEVMILDEPTAMLSPQDADLLYGKLRELADGGKTVIVVTHRLLEVMEFCNEVTVLRGGRLVGSRVVSETNTEELTEMIVGRQVEIEPIGGGAAGEALLTVSGLDVRGHRGDMAVKGARFSLRSGEVVGLAGVDGNGQRELFQALWGMVRVSSGSVVLGGLEVGLAGTRERIAGGLRFIPEDRHDEAVIEEWSILDNGILGLQRLGSVRKGLGIDLTTRAEVAERITTRFPTKFDRVDKPFMDMSGGNQQKVVNARAFELGAKVILAFQPSRGIDINVSALVYKAFREFVRAGGAVLVVSFDIDELLTHCDRILVINHGEVSEPPVGFERDRQAIGRLMVGTG